jgi:hypothetical protein
MAVLNVTDGEHDRLGQHRCDNEVAHLDALRARNSESALAGWRLV